MNIKDIQYEHQSLGSTSVDKTNHSTGADVDLVLLVVDNFGTVFVTMYHVYILWIVCG